MKIRKSFIMSGVLFFLFCFFTILIMKVDVQSIGPKNSAVGLATFNQFVHQTIGVHIVWYEITDVLGIIAIMIALGFAILGLMQLIKRKSLFKVDSDLICLGIYYVIVVIIYIIFEIYTVNYRPILMNGNLSASFPSSHTLIVICILGTAILQFQKRIQKNYIRLVLQLFSLAIIIVTVIGRLVSGVHWVTDIIAGVMLALSLICLYYACLSVIEMKQENKLQDSQIK